jgi:hypothetical protein
MLAFGLPGINVLSAHDGGGRAMYISKKKLEIFGGNVVSQKM